MSVRAILLSCATLASFAFVSACGQTRQVCLSYSKKDTSETRMLSDQEELKRTSGVKQVITHIDAQNNVVLDLYLDEDDSAKGRQKVLDLGYQQVRN